MKTDQGVLSYFSFDFISEIFPLLLTFFPFYEQQQERESVNDIHL